MTNEELQKVKEKTLYKNQLKKIKKKILELEQDPKVKEYLKLTEDFNEKSKDDISIIIDRDHSNIILFEYGRFSLKENLYDYYTSVYLYRDLETKEFFWYTPYYVYKKTFRSYILEDKELEKKDNEFEKVREQFFEQLLDKPQQQVVCEIVKNNKQLVKGRKNELLF